MMKGWMLLGVCFLFARGEDACVHPGRGASVRVSLDGVARVQAEVKGKLAFAWEGASRFGPDSGFDSGLPACGFRNVRRVRSEVPPALVGKTIAFAPADRMERADIRVATRARRIAEIEADALADPALAARLGVRCAPTRVRAVSEVELELVENP